MIFKNKDITIAVVGLGYVGLPIAIELAKNFKVYGFGIKKKRVKAKGIPVKVYETSLADNFFYNSPVIKDLDEFKKSVDIIIANRISDELEDVSAKVFSRDLFQTD